MSPSVPLSAELAAARSRLPGLYRRAEPELLAELLPAARLSAEAAARVRSEAGALLAALRDPRHGGWIDRLLQQYPLNTDEGVALLALAEAYLRVPDAATADALIRDKLAGGDWAAQRGASDSFLVNRATDALATARALLGDGPQAGALRRAVARLGEPAVRQGVAVAMKIMGEQFVLGRDIGEALRTARRKDHARFRYSFDMLGEAARTRDDAQRYFEAYRRAIDAVGAAAHADRAPTARDSVSVKLSALHCRYEVFHAAEAVPELTARVVELARAASAHGIGLTIDAEESERLEMSLDIVAGVAADAALAGWDGLGLAVQAYQRRASAVIAWADALGAATRRRLTVRLVKGAYWDSEIKRAQERGLVDYPLFTRKAATDVSYLACARAMLASPNLYPAFATHNALSVATILEWAGARRDFEFQRLHGMGVGLYEALIDARGYAARVYAPVGGHRELLAYLVRRLLENGANTSFVHQIADRRLDDDRLLADPVAAVEAAQLQSNPGIPMPLQIFGARRNSSGLDLSDAATLDALQAAMRAAWARPWRAAPWIGAALRNGAAQQLLDPADSARVVGEVVAATPADVADAVVLAARAQPAWDATPVETRAACLERLADLLEGERETLMALAVREAGKSVADALAEVREAVDFCRYYAQQARAQFAPQALPGPTGERNELRLAGRGVFACISPWNFPLAIFIGQVAAALVAGNTVVAKPAPQTPLIAAEAVRLLREAGVPADAIHLVPGGPEVGAALVAERRVAGVAFTGSTATARRIARTLLDDETRPLVPLIAETGGLNAMFVDSTALPEQVVADVLVSAFQSAGQRCSALRLLCLQDDIADTVLDMLRGAMAALAIGDPAQPATDVGPVIDAAAQARLLAHLDAQRERIVAQCALPAGCERGHFVPPTVIRLDAVEDLRDEVFGPVLHVVRWKAGELAQTVERVNASGYGLTMGLHSRRAGALDEVRARARVGNLYVNRTMIGAVVGSQPFGGEGLSGTGPKAGGPHYLLRFATERTLSVDTTSAGGNASLLSLDA
ncbi:bifunctional proline dehydrogenase/L-glutamate gamma-semialdehyde dehydrogenase PutA [Solimonas variicoloris]|uniref:bifunctional proline dehydrogenase/L-glutamate gamma-semialdehyde dehydrogenase PutA n=1 Tax=Solimonas variicoloris TaxID=254408 RepID=UPI000376F4EC|nr:bifunctional proline dehydrogenase/L-glutamate gamma-semialdehyde dehydrogenase PutA [Solimonas variicoloris]